ncbi:MULTISPECIES: sugar 3,4-ketoisomerase [unclassified Arsukibacterium]|uniref:sugar 3,4-ketoisomerase n=1 Tax=unclassified Arsukibacterium TaxID=2635278 RepID=UPI000C98ACEA|nr:MULTISPECIES: FdtA/QdtA family cupin domain-containing protein [unclassified Arsukibacterium]MAA96141.1 dTDP-6-deoxy-3,4-keto-hexulose isomerase [Rheinheimera sp.]HAW94462.1 dTDP-6-deoxy-3,4-keto-hexulose isomerase [Candidatus Azambacteria bacterium]|tara:strand:+ start:30511 stop:30912 length:402 start_codon:yes stop_codon:yes gene_type:complete
MSLVKWVELQQRGDERGYLTIIEARKNIPFDIKRIYFLTSLSSDMPRGFHAHHQLEQLAVCVAGSCEVLLDNGYKKERVKLQGPDRALRIEPKVWHEMYGFSKDCVFLVVASEVYDEADYIRDYQLFLEQVKS